MIKANQRTSRVKSLFLVGVAAMLATGAVLSAEGDEKRDTRSPGQHGMSSSFGSAKGFRDPTRMVKGLARYLDLDETQEQALNNVVDAAKPEFETLRERARTNFTAMRELATDDPDYSAKLSNLAIENGELVTQGTLLMGRVRAEVNAELTDEQRAQLDARISEGRDRRGRGRRGNRRERSEQ